jgi:hypothetical protein
LGGSRELDINDEVQDIDLCAIFAENYYKEKGNQMKDNPFTFHLQEKITECESRYFAQNLPAVCKLTDYSDLNIDKIIEDKGYETVTPTYVMDMDLRSREFQTGDCVTTSGADDKWLNAYFSFSHYTDEIKIETAVRNEILTRIDISIIF